VPFAYPPAVLPPAIIDNSRGNLKYDDLAKQLTFAGYLDAPTLANMQATAAGETVLLTGLTALAAANTQAVDAFFAANDSPALGLRALFDAYAASADPDRLGILLRALMPVLANLRKQEQALALVATAAGSDPVFPSALLTDTGVLRADADLAAAAIEDFTALARPGLSAAFFLGNDPTAAADQTSDADPVTHNQNHPLPAAAGGGTVIAARWSGYLAAPQNGDYNLAIALVPGGTVTVSVDDTAVPMADTGGGRFTNQAPIALRAGTLIPIELTVTGLSGTVAAAWQTAGTGWQPIPAASLFSGTLLDRMRRSYLRFLKTVALADDLALTAAEIAYLAKSTELNAGGQGWAAALAVDGPTAPAIYADLSGALDGLLTYARLKATYSPASTRLLDALTSIPMAAGTTPLLALTGWDADSLDTLISRYYGSASLEAVPHPISVLSRLDDAFSILHRCHLTADTLAAAATNDPSAEVVSGFQAAVRSRYAENDWLTVVKPINDTMREMRRDALVAYILLTSGGDILHQLGVQRTASRKATTEDLFSYFLMDVEMQPCMETSRIRHALSAIQLFIERCLRNLEPAVNPSHITAAEWAWRKRFRVWQANREVFLWPENWLEPTLRDDQSPFFKTTMSSLLQSDITDDTAAAAYLDYLTSLEQIAKLEPCGMYYQPAGNGSANDVAHVIARTAGAHRKYYYRCFQQGSWTPWEEIKLNIEDNPVVPYVWNGRLMLFWLQIHHKQITDPSDPGLKHSKTGLADLDLGTLGDSVGQAAKTHTEEQISAVLCFSEYYNGKWQPPKSSDIATPVDLDVVPMGRFQRSAVVLRPWTAVNSSDTSLYVQVTNCDNFPSGLWATWPIFTTFSAGRTNVASVQAFIDKTINPIVAVSYDWTKGAGFVLHNTHSAPLRWYDIDWQQLMGPVAARILTGGRTLTAQYGTSKSGSRGYTNTDFSGLSPTQILSGPLPERTVTAQQDVTDQWDMPFFVEDARNVFYVRAGVRPTWFKDFTGYGAPPYLTLAAGVLSAIPALVVPQPPVPRVPVLTPAGLADPGLAQRAVLSTGTLRAALASTGSLTFQRRQIGAAGSIDGTQQQPGIGAEKKGQP
jgi:Neuraminidase-like domain